MANDYHLGHGRGVSPVISVQVERPDLRAQRAYRARRTAKIERLEVENVQLIAGHQAILAELAGNDKPVAVRIRAISTEALGEAK